MDLKALVKKAAETARETQTVEVTLAGEIVPVTVTAMGGLEWATVTARNPPRDGVLIDARYGYDVHGSTPEALLASGTIDGEKQDAETWKGLLDALSGYDYGELADAIFALNVWSPERRLETLKKSRRAGGKPKQDSPA